MQIRCRREGLATFHIGDVVDLPDDVSAFDSLHFEKVEAPAPDANPAPAAPETPAPAPVAEDKPAEPAPAEAAAPNTAENGDK